MIDKVNRLSCIVKNETSNKDYYPYLIQYRTICIALNFCFNDNKYLCDFNSELLVNEKYKRYNLLFHFFYYSKREFEFYDLVNYNINNSTYEMYYNTFYKLKNSIVKPNERIYIDIISNNQQTIMNIITLLQLIEYMKKNNKTFNNSDNEIIDILCYLKEIFEKTNNKLSDSILREDIYNHILKLIK